MSFPSTRTVWRRSTPVRPLAPLNIDALDLKRYPGIWRAVVTSTTGMTATPPDSVMINLTVTDYEASPNPINRATPTTLTTRFQATPPTRNPQGQPAMPILGYTYDLYTPAGQHIMTLQHPTAGFDPSTATASFATSWNNQLLNPTRPITDGAYLVSFMFAFGENSWEGWHEPAYIQAIWPLYVGVPATQLRNKGSCEFGCSPASYQVVAGDPVNTASGNFLHRETDLTIPTDAEPLTWTRSYNSQALTETSVLGPGWTHPFQLRLVLPSSPLGVANQISLISPSGNHYTFRQSGSTYVPLPGVYATLTADAGGYSVTLPDLTRYRFDLLGRVTTVTTSRGASMQYQYVTSGPYTGLLDRITDASGQRFLALTYTGENAINARLASVRDPLNRTVTYGYQDGMLTTVTDVMGRITTYGLTDGLITTIDHADVRTLTNVYETTTASLPIGHPSAWLYATAPALTAWPPPTQRRVIAQVSGDGVETTYQYASDGTTMATRDGNRVYQEKHWYRPDGSLDHISHETTLGTITTEQATFDPVTLSRTATTDRYGNTLRQTTNARGQATSMTDATGGGVTTTYRAATETIAPNQPAIVRDSLGRETRYQYGPGDVLTSVTTGIAPTTPQGRTTTYTYDQRYPGKHWLEAVTDPLGHTTTYTYNSWGQITAVTDAAGASTTTTYDAVGRVSATADARGTVTRYNYNPDDTVAMVVRNCTDAAGVPSLTGPCAAQTAERNLTTTYGYDPRGRQVWERSPLGTYTAQRYTAAGHVAWRTKGLVAAGFPAMLPTTPPAYDSRWPDQNSTTFYAYDSFGRTTFITETGIVTGSLMLDSSLGWRWTGMTQRVTRFTYDALGRPWQVIRQYDPQQPLTGRSDVNLTTTYTYDDTAIPRATISCDPLNRCTRTAYDALGRVVAVIERYQDGVPGPDAADRKTVTAYTSAGLVDSVITDYQDGIYAPASDPLADLKTAYTYDSWGRVTRVTTAVDPAPISGATDVNRSTQRWYDANDRPYAEQDAMGRITRYRSNAVGQVMETVTNCTGATATLLTGTCDAFTPSQPDRNLRVWTQYTALGQTEAVTTMLDLTARRTTVYRYDPLGRMTVQVDQCTANGQPVIAGCDTPNPTDTTQSDTNRRQLWIYDAEGNVVDQRNPRGFRETFTYDRLNQQRSRTYYFIGITCEPTTITCATTRQQADGTGQVRWQVNESGIDASDPLRNLVATHVDPVGRVVRTVAAADNTGQFGIVTTTQYDRGGRAIATTNADGQTTLLGYRGDDRVTTVVENATGPVAPIAVTTTAQYDVHGNLRSLTDAEQHTRRWQYDSRGLVLTQQDAANHTTTMTYDTGGRMRTKTDPRGSGMAVSYTYDLRDRVTQISSPGLATAITIQYDASGRRTQMTDASGTTSWTYDRADRVATTTQPVIGGLQYGYDATDQRVALTYPSGGPQLGYGYEMDGLINAIDTNRDGTRDINYTHTLDGHMASIEPIGQPFTLQWTYDARGQVIGIDQGRAGAQSRTDRPTRGQRQHPQDLVPTTTFGLRYTLSAAGRHEAMTEWQSSPGTTLPLPAGAYRQYLPMVLDERLDGWNLQYDGLNRLTAATLSRPGDGTPARGLVADETEGATYDRVGNPLTRQRNGSTSGPWSYTAADQRTDWTYDAAGNVLNDGTATATYDALGRLTSRTQGGITSTYTYNGDGLLVASTTNGATTRFLWDTTTPNAQLVGTQQPSGTTWYVWSPMGGGTARVLYSLGPGGRRWLISDSIGSVRRTLSDSGTVIQARQWTPFGVEIGGTASAGLGYAGEWQDASGLVYLRARWYDPAASRFLSRDPWDGMITNPQTLNPYAYAHNQPTRFTDPSGRCIGTLMLFCVGAVVGAGMNFVSQFVQKGSLDAIDWTDVAVSGTGWWCFDAVPDCGSWHWHSWQFLSHGCLYEKSKSRHGLKSP